MIDQDSNRTVRLMHALGLQSGTVWEVCRLLGCVFDDVYHRGPERFEELLVKARSIGDAKRAADYRRGAAVLQRGAGVPAALEKSDTAQRVPTLKEGTV